MLRKSQHIHACQQSTTNNTFKYHIKIMKFGQVSLEIFEFEKSINFMAKMGPEFFRYGTDVIS